MASILNEFTGLEIVGSGAGSTIWRGTSIADGQRYAIKAVKAIRPGDERYIKQAMDEYEIARQFDHPAIIRFYESRRVRSFFKTLEFDIVMEYFEGRMLSHAQGLGIEDLLAIFIQVADALNYMHGIGYVHADIKPENILIDGKLNAKIIDFGVTCRKLETKERIQGTPDFMAPEQVSKKPLDGRTDVYNLGATMYKAITGKILPSNVALVGQRNGDSGVGQMKSSDGEAAIPEDAARIIKKATQRSRGKRYQRMEEMLADLKAAYARVAPENHVFRARAQGK